MANLLLLIQKKQKKILKYAREKYSEIDDKNFKIDKEIGDIDKTISKLREEFRTLHNPKKNTNYQKNVIVQFAAREPCEFLLQLSYIVNGATWKPNYSVRVDTMSKKCILSYQADISNNTGEDWDNVNVTLSTSKPSQEGQPPILPALEVSLSETQSMKKENYRGKSMSNRSYSSMDYDQSYLPEVEEVYMEEMVAETQKSISNSVFQIARPTTIKADNKPHKVTVAHINLDVEFEYIAIPALIQNAYLKAIAVNNSEFSLLEGKMHIFMDSVFVATASIKQTSPGELMELYLGVDINIKIETLPITEQYSVEGIFKRTKSEDISRSCDIYNNRNEDIKIVIVDQLPKSTDERVKVTMTTPNENDVTLTTQNHIRRELVIKARDKERITLSYTLEYPEAKFICVVKEYL